jgi:hypothetical protein
MLTIEHIKTAASKLADDYPIKKLSLFGSYAEGSTDENSDNPGKPIFTAILQQPDFFVILPLPREDFSLQTDHPIYSPPVPLVRVKHGSCIFLIKLIWLNV